MEVNVIIELNGKLESHGAQLAAHSLGRAAKQTST
jgi:hypothetical protein